MEKERTLTHSMMMRIKLGILQVSIPFCLSIMNIKQHKTEYKIEFVHTLSIIGKNSLAAW
jgi:hypothetical protein